MIVVPAACLRAIRDACARAYPREACGLLAGVAAADGAVRVHRVYASANVAAGGGRDRFEVDPAVRFRAMRALAGSGLGIVGHYHSHPDHPARPSATDRAMIFEPDLVWLITAVAGGRPGVTRAFQPWADGRGFDDLELRVAGDADA